MRATGRAKPAMVPRISLVALLVVMLCLLTTLVMVGKLRKGDYKDTEVWYDAGRRALTGDTLVGLRSYRYPPAFAVVIAPLCLLPFPAFFLVWYGLSVGVFFVSLRLAAAIVGADGQPAPTPSRAPALPMRQHWAAAALMSVLAVDNLFLGQTNILVMALVYWALLEAAKRREWRAGFPLAAAIAVKAFPAPLLAYFAYRRHWRAVVATLLFCLFFFLLLPAPVRGPVRNYRETAEWWQRVVGPYLSRGKAGDWGQHALDFGNQSLQAVAHRYLTPVNAYVMARRPQTTMYVNVADLSEEQANWIVLALFGLLGASFVLACGWDRGGRLPTCPTAGLHQATEYSLAIILVLLVSALSWTYFFVMLLLPAAAAVQLLRRPGLLAEASRWSLRIGLWALVGAILLLVNARARALGSLFWATLVLYAGLALACRDLRRAEGAAART